MQDCCICKKSPGHIFEGNFHPVCAPCWHDMTERREAWKRGVTLPPQNSVYRGIVSAVFTIRPGTAKLRKEMYLALSGIT